MLNDAGADPERYVVKLDQDWLILRVAKLYLPAA